MKKIKLSKSLLIILLNGTIALSQVPKVNAENYQNNAITTDAVNMRLDNDIQSDRIGGISENQEVEVLISFDDDWDLVRYGEKIGFVNREYLDGIVDPNFDSNISLITGYVTATSNVRLRLGPSTDYDKIGALDEGQEVEVIGITNNNWYIVRENDKIGFVSGEFCSYHPNANNAQNTNDSNNNLAGQEDFSIDQANSEQAVFDSIYIFPTTELNFREEPDIKGKKLTTLKKNTPLKLKEYLPTGWFLVEYNGQQGYVSADYISFNNGKEYRSDIQKVVYAKTNLNLRSKPNIDCEIYYQLDRYETAEVLYDDGEWYLVRLSNMIGYIKKEYTETLKGKFVVVDISSQKLTLYDGNKIILETDIVTGKAGENDTPTGKYEIRNKETDTYLNGPGYHSHVDYWMPFNGGIGLHDADWRKKFGGNIYVNNGSHGCVNIPPKYADDVYENVSKGTKVLVQK